MKTGKTLRINKEGKTGGVRRKSAYGERVPICGNTACVLRKKAKCSGFEGCPGFKGKE